MWEGEKADWVSTRGKYRLIVFVGNKVVELPARFRRSKFVGSRLEQVSRWAGEGIHHVARLWLGQEYCNGNFPLEQGSSFVIENREINDGLLHGIAKAHDVDGPGGELASLDSFEE
jgi:hypothetical protein